MDLGAVDGEHLDARRSSHRPEPKRLHRAS
jgi:hypothetical protein